MCGALIDYITTPQQGTSSPMGANMGILPRTEEIDTIRDKRERYMALSDAALGRHAGMGSRSGTLEVDYENFTGRNGWR